MTTYMVSGYLPSGCIHSMPIPRERAKRLLKRNTGRSERDRIWWRWSRDVREYDLAIRSAKELPKGYRYRDVRLMILKEAFR